jgi:hypothetical protein
VTIRSEIHSRTRSDVLLLAKDLLKGVLSHRSHTDKKLSLPCSPAAGYPHDSNSWGGGRELELETLARFLFLAAGVLANEPDCHTCPAGGALSFTGSPRARRLVWLL